MPLSVSNIAVMRYFILASDAQGSGNRYTTNYQDWTERTTVSVVKIGSIVPNKRIQVLFLVEVQTETALLCKHMMSEFVDWIAA